MKREKFKIIIYICFGFLVGILPISALYLDTTKVVILITVALVCSFSYTVITLKKRLKEEDKH